MTTKMGFYADGVVCYLINPVNSFRKLIQALETFGTFSGYKINHEKTYLMGLS